MAVYILAEIKFSKWFTLLDPVWCESIDPKIMAPLQDPTPLITAPSRNCAQVQISAGPRKVHPQVGQFLTNFFEPQMSEKSGFRPAVHVCSSGYKQAASGVWTHAFSMTVKDFTSGHRQQ